MSSAKRSVWPGIRASRVGVAFSHGFRARVRTGFSPSILRLGGASAKFPQDSVMGCTEAVVQYLVVIAFDVLRLVLVQGDAMTR